MAAGCASLEDWFDVDWRNDLVNGWNPLSKGSFSLPHRPGLGIEIDPAAIATQSLQAAGLPVALGHNVEG